MQGEWPTRPWKPEFRPECYGLKHEEFVLYMAIPALPACKVMVAVPCLKRLAIRDLPHNTVKFLRILATLPTFLKLPEEAFSLLNV